MAVKGGLGEATYIEDGHKVDQFLQALPEIGVLAKTLYYIEGFEDVNDVVDPSALHVEVEGALLETDLCVMELPA